MGNLEILILTSVFVVLFAVFFIATYREFKTMSKKPFKDREEYESKIQLVNLMRNLFDSEHKSKSDIRKVYSAMSRTIADMESDGVYFPEDVKEELKKRRTELKNETI